MDKHPVEALQRPPYPVPDLAAAKGQAALAGDLLALIHELNRSGDSTMVVPGEYLEVVVARR